MKSNAAVNALFSIVFFSTIHASAFSWECFYEHEESDNRIQIFETTLEQQRTSTEYVRGGDNSPKYDYWMSATHTNRDKTKGKSKGFYNFNLASKVADLLQQTNPQIKVVPGYHAVKSASKIVLRTDLNKEGKARQVTLKIKPDGKASVDLDDIMVSEDFETILEVAKNISTNCRR